MKALIFASVFLSMGVMPARAASPFENGGRSRQIVVCYAMDSQWVEYRARGYRQNVRQVKQMALQACRFESETPGTCRFTRCRVRPGR